MLIENFPDVLALSVEDKWRLLDELWQALAREVGAQPADPEIVVLLEKRFAAYQADPSEAIPAGEMWQRLERRRQAWK